jgi:predicted CxxxxCH...CXXCH cytochrome family protein
MTQRQQMMAPVMAVIQTVKRQITSMEQSTSSLILLLPVPLLHIMIRPAHRVSRATGILTVQTFTATVPGSQRLYCHSTGQSTTDGGSAIPTYSNPTWANAASGACGTCHEKDVGSLISGSHDPHLQSAVVSGCGDCHDNVLNDASAYNSFVTHVNKKIDVAAANT